MPGGRLAATDGVWRGGEEDFRVLTVRAGNRGGGRVLTKEHERGRVRPAVALKVCLIVLIIYNKDAGEIFDF